MTREKIVELLGEHLVTVARVAYLKEVEKIISRNLKIARRAIAEEINRGVQNLDGMPRSGRKSDPTAEGGLKLAAGWEPDAYTETQKELDSIRDEIAHKEAMIAIVEIMRDAVPISQWVIVRYRAIYGMEWDEVCDHVQKGGFGKVSKSTAKRRLQNALGVMEAVTASVAQK